jgi:hypothetical protein
LKTQPIKGTVGASSLQNQLARSRESKFFAGHGSVKDLVKSYEELPNKQASVTLKVILVLKKSNRGDPYQKKKKKKNPIFFLSL